MSRLEVLQRGVQRFGEGDLAARVPVQGHDEVADLSRQFNAAAGRIEALLRSHKSLLANASHELRSPLARIRMGMELMQDGAPSASAGPRSCATSPSSTSSWTKSCWPAAWTRASRWGSFEVVDLVGLAAEECARTGAELDAGNQPLEVHAVAKLLRRALRNLLENARRYSDGTVSVSLHLQGAWQKCGCAIRGQACRRLRERIFEPFYRLPGASERAGGVGLGLAWCAPSHWGATKAPPAHAQL